MFRQINHSAHRWLIVPLRQRLPAKDVIENVEVGLAPNLLPLQQNSATV